MAVQIGGNLIYLWRAVDAEGEVLDVLVQAKHDMKAVGKLMRKLLKRQGMAPDEWLTDKNPAYGAALRTLKLTRAPHTRWERANNRAESSHVPVRRRERKLQGFKSPGSAQRFLSMHAVTYNVFTIPHHLVSARTHRLYQADRQVHLPLGPQGGRGGGGVLFAARGAQTQRLKAAAAQIPPCGRADRRR